MGSMTFWGRGPEDFLESLSKLLLETNCQSYSLLAAVPRMQPQISLNGSEWDLNPFNGPLKINLNGSTTTEMDSTIQWQWVSLGP